MDTIYAFWEGKMPAYIEMCMATWKFPYVLLDYGNLNEYTDLDIEKIRKFSLAQIADIVRVHVLRDHGGYWLDSDTIMLSDKLPDAVMAGDRFTRMNSVAYLHTEAGSAMFREWAEYQDKIIDNPNCNADRWSLFSNDFTDQYVSFVHVPIYPIDNCWPEIYMIPGTAPRMRKYREFYFDGDYFLSDIHPTDMIMLHNSWTPKWYRDLSEDEVLDQACTLSNFLRTALSKE